MKRLKAMAAGALALSLASGGAHAALQTGLDEEFNPLPGELFLMVFDSGSGGRTYIQDLNVEAPGYGFDANNVAPISLAASFSAFLAGGTQSNMVYGVFGVNDAFGIGEDGIWSTASQTATGVGIPGGAGVLNAAKGQILAAAFDFNGASGGGDFLTVLGQSSEASYRQPDSTDMASFGDTGISWANTAALGAALDFFRFAQVDGVYGETKFNGSWALNVASSTIAWTTGGTAPIPIPAGVWLLGSALLGLVGVGRRARTAQLAADK